MEIISNPTQVEIRKAAQALKDGHLVAFPTETVYGLGADATNENAVSRVYSVKGRPTDHPLIVHISSINQLGKWAVDIPEYAIKLAEEFWPGPMTLILKRSEVAKDFITGGQDLVGLRVPSHPIVNRLLNEFEKLGGIGIAAPSANRFGSVSPTSADDVLVEIGRFVMSSDLLLGSEHCSVGIESTIIKCSDSAIEVLRPGAVTRSMIRKTIKLEVNKNLNHNLTKTSGQFQSHYAPRAKVIIGNLAAKNDGFIAPMSVTTPTGALRLFAPETVEEYAQGLYRALRLGDEKRLKQIVVSLPQGSGLAEAIRDRLKKAASVEIDNE
jgi:L-threonylcarbamoyladenylate synthase